MKTKPAKKVKVCCPHCGEVVKFIYEYQKVWERHEYLGNGEYMTGRSEVVEACMDDERRFLCPHCNEEMSEEAVEELLKSGKPINTRNTI